MAVCGLIAAVPASAQDLPVEAPEGKRWMSCFVRLKDPNGSQGSIAVGGYWLVTVPDGARSATETELKAKWLEEYVPRVPKEFPGKTAVQRYNGDWDANCTSYRSRQEWPNFVRHVKEPLSSKSVLRSDYVPSFSTGHVSTREHAAG